MKRMVWLLILALAISAIAWTSAETTQAKKLTVLVYMVGTDLESVYGQASKTIRDIEKSGFDDNEMNLVIMAGGARQWMNGFDPELTGFYQVGNGRSRIVQSVPAMNMGKPETLTLFLNYAVEAFPADQYGLILWGHGEGGPEGGFGYDEREKDLMTLQELDQAFRESVFSGQNKLAWIAFDASLMGNLEVAMTCAPYAKCMIADELHMPLSGLDFSFLSDLKGDMTAEAIGSAIINSYMASAERNGNVDIAAACTDLSALEAVCQARDALFSALNRTFATGGSAELAEALRNANIVSHDSFDNYHLYDLKLLAAVAMAYAPEETDALLKALENAVLYYRGTVEGATGLSAYYKLS